jgi:hypothetical protein
MQFGFALGGKIAETLEGEIDQQDGAQHDKPVVAGQGEQFGTHQISFLR